MTSYIKAKINKNELNIKCGGKNKVDEELTPILKLDDDKYINIEKTNEGIDKDTLKKAFLKMAENDIKNANRCWVSSDYSEKIAGAKEIQFLPIKKKIGIKAITKWGKSGASQIILYKKLNDLYKEKEIKKIIKESKSAISKAIDEEIKTKHRKRIKDFCVIDEKEKLNNCDKDHAVIGDYVYSRSKKKKGSETKIIWRKIGKVIEL